MRTVKYAIILLVSVKTFGQTKPFEFYNENEEKITKEEFLKSKDYSKNLDLYFENDSLQFGLLIKRQHFGQLDPESFSKLKTYLSEISQTEIDSTQNIVVNYLTAFPEKEAGTDLRSKWDIFDKNYLKELHKVAEINQFWIHSPEVDNLEYYYQNKIDWIADKDDLFKNMFFPYSVRYGNFILIKQDGKYYYYLGEHSKRDIWKKSEKYFK